MINQSDVLAALKRVEDPELHRSVVDLNMVRDIQIDGNKVSLEIVLTISGCPLRAKIEEDVVRALKALGAQEVNVRFGTMTEEERARLASQLRGKQGNATEPVISPLLAPGSKTTFIAIASGKGGVGKSTVTVNLAVALARLGQKVGIIDADIYGFSVPDMMGIEQRPTVIDDVILPVERFGVKVMSMGFFVEENRPVIWRGPMLGKMLRNFFSEVHWDDIDYMFLDLPPGTGDVALDVHQMIPQSKEIIVTTPHATAAFVAARAGAMALKTNHQLLGVVENMAYYQCSACGNKDYIFGRGGGAKLAQELHTDLLAQIPLGLPDTHPQDPDFSPSVYKPDTAIGEIYLDLARKVMEKVNAG
ncbi:P-loop NTPase [Bacillaceae bacterium]